MPSPFSTLTAVTPTTGQIKASDLTQVVTAYGNMPRGIIATATPLTASTAATTSTTAPGADSGMSVSITVPTGRRIRIGWDGFVGSSVVTDVISVYLLKDGTAAGNTVLACIAYAGDSTGMIFEEVPAAGTHTYRIYYVRNTGTGSVYIYGGAISTGVQPNLYAEDMGAS
jgi:hypothetical protein